MTLRRNITRFKRKVNKFKEDNHIFSDRQNDTIYDIVGESGRLRIENANLRVDVERLKEKIELERTLTHGNELNEEHLEAAADHLLKMSDSTYDSGTGCGAVGNYNMVKDASYIAEEYDKTEAAR